MSTDYRRPQLSGTSGLPPIMTSGTYATGAPRRAVRFGMKDASARIIQRDEVNAEAGALRQPTVPMLRQLQAGSSAEVWRPILPTSANPSSIRTSKDARAREYHMGASGCNKAEPSFARI